MSAMPANAVAASTGASALANKGIYRHPYSWLITYFFASILNFVSKFNFCVVFLCIFYSTVRHVWNGVADARVHKLPGDARLLRDVKVGEVPMWAMNRNVSPVGVWYATKRAMMRSMTIHQSDKVAMHRFSFFQTKMLPMVGIFYYFMHYSAGHLDLQTNAKHH